MARRPTRNRMELRDQYEAAEAREKETREGENGEAEEVAEADGEPAVAAEAAAPVKKKKAAVVKEPKEPKKRTRTAKIVRQKVVWVVFDNSNKRIQAFPYNQRQDADGLATKLATEKKATYFVQPVKEPIEE